MESRKEYFTLERQGPKPGLCERGGTCCACLLFLGILLLIAGAVTLLCFLIMLSAEHGDTVETPCGKINGMYHVRGKAVVFKGIPYAKPPVGELRWRDAEELKVEEPEEEGGEVKKCWEGTLSARSEPNKCVMHHGEPGTNTSSVSGHEDCLYLNVYVPDLKYKEKKQEEEVAAQNGNQTEPTAEPAGGSNSKSNKSLPVMFYIHGYNTEEEYMPPTTLAEELEVILVVPQFRMGALGFMVLDNFDPDQMGNYGVSDILAALKWVNKNIKGFGGDPEKVTIFGPGMGGTIVWGLMTNIDSRDLFSRAWVMSGSADVRKDMTDAASATDHIWDDSGCEDAACLREMTVENITMMYQAERPPCPYNALPTLDEKNSAQMVVFGHLSSPLHELHGGGAGLSDVPLLVGSAAQSIDFDPVEKDKFASWDMNALLEHMEHHLLDFGPDVAKDALDLYNFTNKDMEFIYSTIVSDIRYVCQHNAMAKAASDKFTEPVYRYVLRIGPSSGAKAYGSDFTANYAFKGWDMYALFDRLGDILEGGETEEDKNLRKILIENVKNFVHEGRLEAPWNEFPDTTALLSNSIDFTSRIYHEEVCKFWNDVALTSYAAIH